MQDAFDWLDKNPLAEKDECEAKHKELEGPDRVVDVHVDMERPSPTMQSAQEAEVRLIEVKGRIC